MKLDFILYQQVALAHFVELHSTSFMPMALP